MLKRSITDGVDGKNQSGDHWFYNVMLKNSFNTQVKFECREAHWVRIIIVPVSADNGKVAFSYSIL